jgi:hypothetical protein
MRLKSKHMPIDRLYAESIRNIHIHLTLVYELGTMMGLTLLV